MQGKLPRDLLEYPAIGAAIRIKITLEAWDSLSLGLARTNVNCIGGKYLVPWMDVLGLTRCNPFTHYNKLDSDCTYTMHYATNLHVPYANCAYADLSNVLDFQPGRMLLFV